MRCSTCHYVSPPDGPVHNARTCPLRQTQCRHSLREGHPFFLAGQCVSVTCIRKKKCNTCGVPSHLYGTQALNTRRWKFNSKGRLVRKQTKKALCKEDFVCPLMTDLSMKSMVDNSMSVSTAAARDAHQRRVSVSRLRGNIHTEKLDIDETVRVLEDAGSEAALLQPKNKAAFKASCDYAHLGAVAAGRAAASAAESSMDEDSPHASDDDAEEDDDDASGDDSEVVASLAKFGRSHVGGSGKNGTSHALKVHRRGKMSRTDRYASAVALGQRRSPVAGSSSSKRAAAGKAVKKSIPEPIDVDAPDNTAGNLELARGWPLATRQRFEEYLPVLFSPRFGGMPPAVFAHAVAVELCHCPLDEVDAEVAGLIVKRATDKHVRGYMLTSGTLCSAQVAEWLCSAMPEALRSATLPSLAQAVKQVVSKQALAAATSSGVGPTPAAAAMASCSPPTSPPTKSAL